MAFKSDPETQFDTFSAGRRRRFVFTPEEGEFICGVSNFDPDFMPPPAPLINDRDDASWPADMEERANLRRLIPSFCLEVPKMEVEWVCPAAQCGYTIDLVCLTEDQVKDLPRPVQHMLTRLTRARPDKLKEESVHHYWRVMVDDHYMQHCREAGVEVLETTHRDGMLVVRSSIAKYEGI